MANLTLTTKQKNALERVSDHPELQPYLFNEAKGLAWFDAFVEKGWLNPADFPGTTETPVGDGRIAINSPSWHVVEYLVNASELLSDPANEAYAKKFLDFIRATTKEAKKNKLSNHRVWYKLAVVLKNIPTSLLRKSDVNVISWWFKDSFEHGLVIRELTKWVEKLLNDGSDLSKSMVTSVAKVLLKTKFERKYKGIDYKKIKFRLEEYATQKFFEKVSKQAGVVIGEEFADAIVAELQNAIVKEDMDAHSAVVRPAIGDHKQNHIQNDAIQVLITSLRETLLGYASEKADAALPYLLELSSHEHITIRRIALYVLDQSFEEYSEDTIQYLIDIGLFDTNIRHETWHFLHRNFENFSNQHQQDIVETILSLEDKYERPETKAYYEAIWISSIKEKTPELQAKYQELVGIVGEEPDHPDFPYFTTTGWGGNKSPYSVAELDRLCATPLKLVELLNGYKAEKTFDGPNTEGLAKQFRALVKAKIESFTNDLTPYENLHYPYLYELFEAVREAWAEEVAIQSGWANAWTNVFAFIAKLITDEKLKAESQEKYEGSFVGTRQWVLGAIAELIRAGCQKKERAFDRELAPEVVKIIALLMDYAEGFVPDENHDAVSAVINNPRGKLVEAVIDLALHSARTSDSKDKWTQSEWLPYKQILENELNVDKHGYYDFVTLCAMYLPNFKYLDEQWAKELPGKVFDTKNQVVWQCAMHGFAYLNKYDADLYQYLRESGDALKALDTFTESERVGDRVLDFILISYMRNEESIDDPNSLISVLLKRRKISELSHIINFFWRSSSDEENEILTQKVYELWPKILEGIDLTTDEGKKLASRLCHWASYLKELTKESKSWVMRIAEFAEYDYNSHDLIEFIARLSETNQQDAYEIWCELLKVSSFPYPDEEIKRALRNLMANGTPSNKYADPIAKMYAEYEYREPLDWVAEIQG